MKKILVFILTITLFASCGEDFLDLSPKDRANINDFYASESDFEVALIGAYGTFMGSRFADQLPMFFDMRSDNAFALGNFGIHFSVHEFTLDANSGLVAGFYDYAYRGIQAANAIVDRIDGVEMNDAVRDRLKGEALFIRALEYFYLVQIYGDVPLILSETSGANLEEAQQVARTPVSQVYSQIISDLEEAETLLPDEFDTPNRASASSVKTLLGKVHLFLGNNSEAAAKLAEVIGEFSLLTDYAELFGPGNSRNSESIFAIEHIGGPDGTGSGLAFQMNPSGTTLGGFNIVNQAFYAEENLRLSYTTNDSVRRDMTAQAFEALPGDESGEDTVFYCRKYVDDGLFNERNGSNTTYIFRYADVLLMRAEALNETGYVADGEAFAHLNEVRLRAGLEALNATDLPDQASFKDAVFDERRLELAFEGHRFTDLIRKGDVIDVINAYHPLTQIGPNDLLYPIPENEVLGNPDVIIQNPGY